MNFSLITADRGTYCKIVATAWIAAMVFIAVGLATQVEDNTAQRVSAHQPVLKAGAPVNYTHGGGIVVR